MNGDRKVYVTRESQKYHLSRRCAGDSVTMSLREAHDAHHPCMVCTPWPFTADEGTR